MVKILSGDFAGRYGVLSNKTILIYCGWNVEEIDKNSVEWEEWL